MRERSQRTDKEEFYATANLKFEELQVTIHEWQHYYNWQRTHGSLKGKTPMEKVCALIDETPLSEEIYKNYDRSKERIQEANYQTDLALRRLKAETE